MDHLFFQKSQREEGRRRKIKKKQKSKIKQTPKNKKNKKELKNKNTYGKETYIYDHKEEVSYKEENTNKDVENIFELLIFSHNNILRPWFVDMEGIFLDGKEASNDAHKVLLQSN